MTQRDVLRRVRWLRRRYWHELTDAGRLLVVRAEMVLRKDARS